MSFRKNNENSRKWSKWLAENQNSLQEIGLPRIVSETEEHWWDFLEHGYLDHHFDPSNFVIESLPSNKRNFILLLSEELSAIEKKSVPVFKELKSELRKS